MWKPPRPDCHADMYFEYGLRLPLHPFFHFVLQILGCGLSQLVSNTVLQINGVIARCHKLHQFPNLDLFFFPILSTGIQFYIDKKKGCKRLVEAPVSNSGWHGMWAWYEGGPELGAIGPWQALSPGCSSFCFDVLTVLLFVCNGWSRTA